MLDTTRRRTLAYLNSRYICGRIPLLHSLIFLIEMVCTIRLMATFNAYYAQKPLLTTMITNALLGGVSSSSPIDSAHAPLLAANTDTAPLPPKIADTVAQGITAYKTRALLLPRSNNNNGNSDAHDARSFISSGVELDDLNEKPARHSPALSPHFSGPAPFDFERLTRYMSYGFLWASVQFQWFGLLTRLFPITAGRGTVPALQRVAVDQLIYAPIGLAVFFTFMTVTEGGSRKQVIKKFQDIYIPTLRANYLLWPAVQILNFRVIPLPLQIPFVSTIGIAWTAYLSLSNSAEDDSMDA
ncbi:hypothetical protein DV736_g5253, partial [Chaetothyriales sp. CBS 134916]